MVSGNDLESVFARRLRQLRIARGWTVEDLAASVDGLSAASLYRLEQGKRRVHLNDAFEMAMALGVSPLALLLPATDEPVGTSPSGPKYPARAVYEWIVGGLEVPGHGRVSDQARFKALAKLHQHLPYAVRLTRRTIKVAVNKDTIGALYNMMINTDKDAD